MLLMDRHGVLASGSVCLVAPGFRVHHRSLPRAFRGGALLPVSIASLIHKWVQPVNNLFRELAMVVPGRGIHRGTREHRYAAQFDTGGRGFAFGMAWGTAIRVYLVLGTTSTDSNKYQ